MPDPMQNRAPMMLRWLILLPALALVIVYAFKRDLRFEKEDSTDLRNRVVGARIIRDGGFPYYYKWKNGDGLRYYDPGNFDTLKAAVITASPFFHRLLSPVADWPQARIQRFWFGFEYAVFTAMMLFFFFHARTTDQKQAVLLLFGLFLLTNAWKFHIATGQLYICIPLFAFLFYCFLQAGTTWPWALAAGAAAACLVLIRPNALIFFLPFLFLARNYPRTWLIAFPLPALALAGWILLSPHERALWTEYSDQMGEQLKLHQGLHPTTQHNDPNPHFRNWEGLDEDTMNRMADTDPVKIYTENGNVFVLYKNIFHRKLPVIVLSISAFTIIGIFLLLFYRREIRNANPDPVQIAIFGFCLYMISDLFSPYYRHQYYTVQWIFPLLLAAAYYNHKARIWYMLILAGLLFNCIHLPFIRMGNTIGEYLILASLLLLSLFSGPKANASQPFRNVPKNY